MSKKSVLYLTAYNIKRWKSRYHVIMGLIYLCILGDMMLGPTRKLISVLGVKPTAFAFPLIWNSTLFLMMFFFGVILFFSDAPFLDDMSPFFIIRCGKMKMAAAQVLYIIVVSTLIPTCFFVIQALFLPVSLGNSWGKFWGTIAQTNASLATGSRMDFSYEILWDYEPMEANLIVFCMCILLCMLTGLFLYYCCILHMRTLGICILSGFTVLPHIVNGLTASTSCFHFTTFNWLSPYSFISLDQTMREYNGSLPSLDYAFRVLLIGNLLLIGLILLETRRKEIG